MSCPVRMIWVWVSRSVGRPGPVQRLRGHGDQTQHHLITHSKGLLTISYNRHLKSAPALIAPVNTFQILITPFSKPVARNRLLFPFGGVLDGRATAPDFGGLGPKARPHTGWPQLKLLSPRSISPLWLSLWDERRIEYGDTKNKTCVLRCQAGVDEDMMPLIAVGNVMIFITTDVNNPAGRLMQLTFLFPAIHIFKFSSFH